jgi:hypothetical protein
MEDKMIDILIISLPLAVGCYWVGFCQGKKSRKFPLEGKGAEEALAFFILKEIVRHREDITAAKRDLRKLAKRGVYPPIDLDLDAWVEVK